MPAEFEIRVSERHRTQVVIDFMKGGEPVGRVELEPFELETMIGLLADARARMQDEVAREIDPGTRATSLIHPTWRTEEHSQGKRLAVRHPGFGWLYFVFPPGEAAAIARTLEAG